MACAHSRARIGASNRISARITARCSSRSARQHGRKPDEQYERIERLVAGPYLELFARERRAGWDAWGNEV
jgi:N6-adenosine-specific RNA methylase IME4